MKINSIIRSLPQKGDLRYEYNPLYNYRKKMRKYDTNINGWIKLNKGGIACLKIKKSSLIEGHIDYSKDISLYNFYEKKKKEDSNYYFEPLTNDIILTLIKNGVISNDDFYAAIKDQLTVKEVKNEIGDMTTPLLDFDLNHPVDILTQPSYDGSVNLILNDDKNPTRLINTRFSVTEGDTYQIPQRLNNNDANLYDDSEWEIDTNLKKIYKKIPQVELFSIESGGDMKIGNYVFYFKYIDADGNLTDFIAESGIVSLFIGTTKNNIQSGFGEMSSHKYVSLKIKNLDTVYQNLKIYYSRTTSDESGIPSTLHYEIVKKFPISNPEEILVITGFEEVVSSTSAVINAKYQTWDTVKTQAIIHNKLLLGNISKEEVDYKDLIDLSLRIYPTIIKSEDVSYTDPLNIYNKLGYYPEELYRFGIVYILNDNSLTDVFNVSGYIFNDYAEKTFEESGNEDHIKLLSNIYEKAENNYILDNDGNFIRKYLTTDKTNISETDFNTKGIIKMPFVKGNDIIGIKFNVPKQVYKYLSKKVKGFFFVRQKRIPTVLGQGITVGLENQSKLPVLKNSTTDNYFIERFIDNSGYLTEDFQARLYNLDKKYVDIKAAYMPDSILNAKFFNQIFTGELYPYRIISKGLIYKSPSNERYYIHEDKQELVNKVFKECNIINVNDGVKIISDGKNRFCARAGEAEEAWRFSFIEQKKKPPKKNEKKGFGKIVNWAKNTWNKLTGNKKEPFIQHVNIVRGVYGSYCGLSEYEGDYADKFNVYIQGYNIKNLPYYFDIRANDTSEYYAISNRYEFDPKLYLPNDYSLICYRGDCFICEFTHRINRNFIDPETTLSDDIVNPDTWINNFKQGDLESNNKIVRGDVNSIPIGLWLSMKIRSSLNLNIRGEDLSNENEYALFGRGRQWYPLAPISTESVYKIPESNVYNFGMSANVSNKWNYIFPEVPYIRNEFNTRIIWSNTSVSEAYQNGFRVFSLIDKVDYPKELGSITKIIPYGNNIIGIFDHGIAILGTQPKTDVDGADGEIMVSTKPFMHESNIQIISDMVGSKWADSICQSEGWIYGVDTVAKKIWRTNGKNVDMLSETLGVQVFINHNIELYEREILPIEGLRNVKTHYNAFKKDIMFTFYNGTRGVQEVAWNLCFNEYVNKFITFYSWVPSISTNIDNMYFSFNRKVSKWIAKLANNSERYKPAKGIVLSNITIDNFYLNKEVNYAGKTSDYFTVIQEYSKLPEFKSELRKIESRLSEIRKILKDGSYQDEKELQEEQNSLNKRRKILIENITRLENNLDKFVIDFECKFSYRNFVDDKIKVKEFYLDEDDPYLKYFTYDQESNKLKFNLLKYLIDYGVKISEVKDPKSLRDEFKKAYYSRKDDPYFTKKYMSPIFEINVTAELVKNTLYKDSDSNLFNNQKNKEIKTLDLGKESKKIAVTLECLLDDYERDSLFSTDFWKHGQGGIFDLQDDIKPTHWYGEQHPFEIEFSVNKDIGILKTLSNLKIISNNSEPDSIHFTVVGDHYEWSQDKPNIYFRQEATKALLQKNGYDISYDKRFRLHPVNRLIKSTYLLKEYERQDSLDDLYDTYYGKENSGYNYHNRTGSEIKYNKVLNEYSLVVNQKLVSIDDRNSIATGSNEETGTKEETGRLRGNMYYDQGLFKIEVRPFYITQKNESKEEWVNKVPPILFPKSGFIQEILDISRPIDLYSINNNNNNKNVFLMNLEDELYTDYKDVNNNMFKNVWSYIKSANISDTFIKVRLRYTGKKLTIINAIISLYNKN